MKKSILAVIILICLCIGSISYLGSYSAKAADYIDDGYYRIVSGNDSNYCLDIYWFGSENGTKVQLYNTKTGDFSSVSNELFYISRRSDGYYTIRCAHSGLYLHIQNEGSTTSKVHCWSGGEHYNSHWKITSAPNGYWYLQNRGNSSYMDNSGGNVANGNQIISYPFNGTKAQRFKLVKVSFNDNPLGWFDGAEIIDGKLHVWGWSFDWDNTDTALRVAIQVGSNWYAIVADKYRPDVNDVYNGAGLYHGFDEIIDIGNVGTQEVLAYGINIGSGNDYTLNGGPKTIQTQSSTSEIVHSYYTVNTRSGINVRSGAGTQYGKITALPNNTLIEVHSIESGWAKITYKNITGYVCADYIKFSHETKEKVSEGQSTNGITLQQAMDEIVDRLKGKYFTVSGDECPSCKGRWVSGHACYNCLASSIVNSEWYKKTFPEFTNVDASHFPSIASRYKDSSYDHNGYSCFGFGCWAQWYIYSRVYGEQNFNGQHHFAKGKMTYEFLKNSGAQPGDVIRKNDSHTLLLYSYDESGYVVIDCNGGVSGTKNCVVDKRKMNYSSSKTCVLSRPAI